MTKQEQKEKILQALKNASSLLIIANDTNPSYMLGGAALACVYPKSVLFARQSVKKDMKEALHNVLHERLWNGEAKRGETIITIDTSRSPVKELRYEHDKQTQLLRIRLTPEKNTVSKEHIHIKNTPPLWDVVVLVGIESHAQLKEITQNNFGALIAGSLIYIGDTNPTEEFGNLSYTRTNGETFSEMLYGFTRDENSKNPECATFLFAVAQELLTAPEDMSAQSFKLCANLLEQGADPIRAKQLCESMNEKPADIDQTTAPTQQKKVNQYIVHHDQARNFVWTTVQTDKEAGFDKQSIIDLTESLGTQENTTGSLVITHYIDRPHETAFTCFLAHHEAQTRRQLVSLLGAKEHNTVVEFSILASHIHEAQQKALKLARSSFEHIKYSP